MAKIEVNTKLCKGCELCTLQCAKGLIVMSAAVNEKGYKTAVQHESEKCTACKLCALMCPEAAITVYK
ncbi:MAG: ferredoxin family protein [Eubacteriaceae bacterium]